MNLITGIADCCARAASGHAAAPPRRLMNSRRLMGFVPRAEDHTLAYRRAREGVVHRRKMSRPCRRWVKSPHYRAATATAASPSISGHATASSRPRSGATSAAWSGRAAGALLPTTFRLESPRRPQPALLPSEDLRRAACNDPGAAPRLPIRMVQLTTPSITLAVPRSTYETRVLRRFQTWRGCG
jgi:hypothetical protein